MLEIIDLSAYNRWDIAGVDGLEVAKLWFGAGVDRIAPFQSLETSLDNQPCSVLRLCEANFRISCPSNLETINSVHHRVWVKRFDWLSAIALPDTALSQLQTLAIPKPPFRLRDLKLNCATPARIDGIAILVWRHSVCNQPVIEIQTAQKDLHTVQAKLM